MAYSNDQFSRRSFLKALLVTAATATTAGGGAAYFLNQQAVGRIRKIMTGHHNLHTWR